MSDRGALLQLSGITKVYYPGQENELEVLHGIDLRVRQGEFAAIVGESGSGKSTLMNIIGVLDSPTSGTYLLDGMDISKASPGQMSRIRNEKIGFVFQNSDLIGRTTALENVELPMLYRGIGRQQRRQRAVQLLGMVGMQDRMDHDPNELSGGQKQRVAIARALANDPMIILADEPTGALDSKTSQVVMGILQRLHGEGKTILLITHNRELARECPRIITLQDGRITADTGQEERC